MNKIRSLFALIAIACFASVTFGTSTGFALSDEEAEALIEAEMTAQAEREADRRAELLEVPAVQEWTLDRSGQRTVFRHVAPPVRIAEPAGEETVTKMEGAEEGSPAVSERKSMNLTLFVTVFDDELTKIRVAPLDDGVTVLSNVAFTHQPAIESVVTHEAYYSLFSFVDRVESDSGAGLNRPDSSVFSTTDPEYLVFAEGETEVSPELLEAIDTLHRHYLEHATEFEARAQRAAALRAARERYLEENPPAPQETVINFFPIRSRIHSTDNQ